MTSGVDRTLGPNLRCFGAAGRQNTAVPLHVGTRGGVAAGGPRRTASLRRHPSTAIPDRTFDPCTGRRRLLQNREPSDGEPEPRRQTAAAGNARVTAARDRCPHRVPSLQDVATLGHVKVATGGSSG